MKDRRKRSGKLYGCLAAIAIGLCAVGGVFLLNIEPQEQNSQKEDGSTEKAEALSQNSYEGFQLLDQSNPSQGIVLEEENLILEQVGAYTGAYVEDGSDQQVERVAAVVVRNTSDEMLQLMQLELTIDGKETLFQITNLPGGARVLAMEMSRISLSEESQIAYEQEASVFLEDASLHEDVVEVSGKDGRLTAGNRTGEVLKNVYVYYKTKTEENSYLGGITYRVGFEEIPAQTSIEEEAGHFREESSQILDVRMNAA